jgi:hypothetical protein
MGPTGTTLVGLICDNVSTREQELIVITHKRMRPVVMSLDMVEVGRRCERIILPVELLHPTDDAR